MEVQRIRELSIIDIILSVTNITADQIQPNPFRLPDNKGDYLIIRFMIS